MADPTTKRSVLSRLREYLRREFTDPAPPVFVLNPFCPGSAFVPNEELYYAWRERRREDKDRDKPEEK
jgi:hypothetical protein